VSTLPRNTILIGDALAHLSNLPDASVDAVITSPPYFRLRGEGVPGEIGLEPSVDDWVARLRAVFVEVGRVVKPTGSVFINLGDTYSQRPGWGAPAKSLMCAPERLLLALTAEGYTVRQKIIWRKTNPMPEAIGDRFRSTYDVVYFLVRSRRYWFDKDAVRLPHRLGTPRRPLLGVDPGDVWSLPAASFRGAHFATFPPQLVERPLLASVPERICVACGTPWRRPPAEVTFVGGVRSTAPRDGLVRRYPTRWSVVRRARQVAPACTCNGSTTPGVVLDPFFGTGTVGLVAQRHRRDWVGIEVNPAFAALAGQRLGVASAVP
jgi:site-specific DNA-methyltransferase (adenine-specific)